ncbi:MAG: hypothetical protein QM817_01205 [Archangium sp.]
MLYAHHVRQVAWVLFKLFCAFLIACLITIVVILLPCIVMSGGLPWCGMRSAPENEALELVSKISFGVGLACALTVLFWPRKKG